MDIKIKYEKGFIKPDKNSLILLGIVFVSAILVGIGLFYYFKKEPEPEVTTDDEIFKQLQRQEILGQLEELESSKEEIPPLSSEDIKEQLKELNSL